MPPRNSALVAPAFITHLHIILMQNPLYPLDPAVKTSVQSDAAIIAALHLFVGPALPHLITADMQLRVVPGSDFLSGGEARSIAGDAWGRGRRGRCARRGLRGKSGRRRSRGLVGAAGAMGAARVVGLVGGGGGVWRRRRR